MKLRRLGAALLACLVVFSFAALPASAASAPSDTAVVMRAGGRIDCSISAHTIAPVGTEFYLEKGDKITFDCTYTPKYSRLDFGYLDSNYAFHYLDCVNGSIYEAVSVPQSGQYTIAIRNNEDYAVTIKGTIKY